MRGVKSDSENITLYVISPVAATVSADCCHNSTMANLIYPGVKGDSENISCGRLLSHNSHNLADLKHPTSQSSYTPCYPGNACALRYTAILHRCPFLLLAPTLFLPPHSTLPPPLPLPTHALQLDHYPQQSGTLPWLPSPLCHGECSNTLLPRVA